jgi:peroxiredoxin
MATNDDVKLQGWVDERMKSLSSDSSWRPDILDGLARLREAGMRRSKEISGRIALEVVTGRGKPRPYGTLASRSAWNWSPAWGWTIAAIVGAAIILLMLASPSPRVLAQRCMDCSIALWHGLSATSEAAPPTDIIPEAARKAAKDFALADTNQKMIRLSSYKGQVVLLNFWASWCGGCKTEMPWFVELQDEFRDRGVSAIGVSLDEDGIKAVEPYLAKHPVNYTIVVGPEELGRVYGVEAMPVTMLLDRSGRIAVKHVGLVTKKQYQSEIAALLTEKMDRN